MVQVGRLVHSCRRCCRGWTRRASAVCSSVETDPATDCVVLASPPANASRVRCPPDSVSSRREVSMTDSPSLARTTTARRSAYQVTGHAQRCCCARCSCGSSAAGDRTPRPVDLLDADGLRDLQRQAAPRGGWRGSCRGLMLTGLTPECGDRHRGDSLPEWKGPPPSVQYGSRYEAVAELVA